MVSIKFWGSVEVSADSASAVYSRRSGLRTLGQSVSSLTYVRTASRFSHFGPPHRHCLQAFELGGLFRPERARAVAHHLLRAHAGSLYAGKRLLRIVHKHVLIRTTCVSWAGPSGDFVRRTLSTGPAYFIAPDSHGRKSRCGQTAHATWAKRLFPCCDHHGRQGFLCLAQLNAAVFVLPV